MCPLTHLLPSGLAPEDGETWGSNEENKQKASRNINIHLFVGFFFFFFTDLLKETAHIFYNNDLHTIFFE